jgi:hypothetical protein
MSFLSFTAHPLPLLMPNAIQRSQDLVCRHLVQAGLGEFAQEQPNGGIAEQFDQQTAATRFDTLREEALASMHEDVRAGRELIRVMYNDRAEQFSDGALDPSTAGRSERRWAECIEAEPDLVAVWGLSFPLFVRYLDGSTRWELRSEAIVVVDTDSPWRAKKVARSLVSAGSSPDAPCLGWAGQIRTVNTELAQVFGPTLWDGGRAVSWRQLTDGSSYSTAESLSDEDRAKLLAVLSKASMAERVIRLRRTMVA